MAKINMIRVESSQILEVGYDKESKVLVIIFKGGSKYKYFNVEEKEYLGLMNAESVGKYFKEKIKDIYGFERVVFQKGLGGK